MKQHLLLLTDFFSSNHSTTDIAYYTEATPIHQSTMSIMKISVNAIETFGSCLKLIRTLEEVNSWLKHTNEIIFGITKYTKGKNFSHSQNSFHKLKANLSTLKTYYENIKHIRKSNFKDLERCRIQLSRVFASESLSIIQSKILKNSSVKLSEFSRIK